MNDQYKNEIISLNKKIFELENSSNQNKNNMSIYQSSDINIISNKKNFDTEKFQKISAINVCYYEKKQEINLSRKKSKK